MVACNTKAALRASCDGAVARYQRASLEFLSAKATPVLDYRRDKTYVL
jgi:hypothetical protein